jgi:transcriptional repressor of dcmA and dcmR
MSDQEVLLDIKQAAQFLRVSETSLRRWTNSGLLASLRVGQRRERRFRRADLVAFMEHHPAGSTRPTGSHLCSLYNSDLSRAAQAAAFLGDGVEPGTAWLLIAQPEVRAAIVIRLIDAGRLARRGSHTDPALLESGSAPSRAAQLDYYESTIAKAMKDGARRLRIVADVSGGGLASDLAAMLELETEYHRRIAGQFPVMTLCQYDARALSGIEVLEVFKCHGENFSLPAERFLG